MFISLYNLILGGEPMVTREERLRTNKQWNKRFLPLVLFPLSILWMELILKFWDFGTIWNKGLLYTSLFSCFWGLLFGALCMVWTEKINRILMGLVLLALTAYFIMQASSFTVMQTVLALYSVSVAADATEFWRVGVYGVWRTMPIILLLAIPFVGFLIRWRKHIVGRSLNSKQFLLVLSLAVLFYGVAFAAVFSSRRGIMDPWVVYHEQTNPELSVANFGALTTLRLDMKKLLFGGMLQGRPTQVPVPHDRPEGPYPANVMDIDFEQLAKEETDETLQALHRYFGKQAPSLKNEYTGMFAGKNLIMITAEAFNSWAIDAQRTPTLYRLSKEGFVCKNFYTPLWWVSTSDGEYVSCTSLIPKPGEQSFGLSSDNSLYFCMGNQLGALGYTTNAYHDHTYTYYGRDRTHPNMGYDTFQGVGNGLELEQIWPESDREMMEKTLPDYLGKEPFHTYYVTVSGHLQYFYDENAMARKHWDMVSDLDLSEEAKAYLACQVELDQAVEYLLRELEAAGQLENTVICLYGDHYPYGLSAKAIEELGGPDLKGTSQLYKSTLILWAGDMKEPVYIEKPCSNLDILPTLSNLFGLEFDSRLLMGRDILSNSPGLVSFSDYSYITEQGEYSAQRDVFEPKEGVLVEESYPAEMMKIVQDRFFYSKRILTTDYYRVLGLIPQKP